MPDGRLQQTFTDRAEIATNGVAKRLYSLMSQKETNLCLSLDVTDPNRFLSLAETIGPEIAVLKTHVDTLENYSGRHTTELSNIARDHDFLIFEDRKFADIGNTVRNQYTKGIFHIIEWADIVNAHAIAGPSIIEGLRDEVANHDLLNERALLLLAQMSTKDNLINDDYTATVVKLAEQYPDFVIGFIGAQAEKLPVLAGQASSNLVIMTPGVQLADGGDLLGQTYNTPEAVVAAGADVVIVGRGIFNDPKPLAKAKEYREAAWQAYQRRIEQSKVQGKPA